MSDEMLFLMSACCILGWTRLYRSPEDVYRNSELIVIAKLNANSIRRYPVLSGRSGVHEYAAVLTVSEILKGKLDSSEVPIVIHHGITPVVGGYLNEPGCTIDSGHRRDTIELWDTGNSAVSREPFVKDAKTDHIWFLRRHSDYFNFYDGPIPDYAHELGIVEPDEVLPLNEKDAVVNWISQHSDRT